MPLPARSYTLTADHTCPDDFTGYVGTAPSSGGRSPQPLVGIFFAVARFSRLSRMHGLRPPQQRGFSMAVKPIHASLGPLERMRMACTVLR
jgi:hypothetical protein